MTTAVATTSQNTQVAKPQKTIRGLLEGDSFKMQVARALPKHLTPDRFIRVACTALTRTPKLAECDQASFFNALLNLSQLGIEPDGRRAHLIPRNNTRRNCMECQLIIDYKGLAELAMRSGVVSNIHADIVCENDEFEYDRGELKKHKIDFRKERGEMYAAYALCRFKDGSEKCEVMSKAEIDNIRHRSPAGKSGPWVTDYFEMCKKTAFRRLSKWLPLSPEYRDALDADADAVVDTKFDATRAVMTKQANVIDAEELGGLPETTDDGDGAQEQQQQQQQQTTTTVVQEPPKQEVKQQPPAKTKASETVEKPAETQTATQQTLPTQQPAQTQAPADDDDASNDIVTALSAKIEASLIPPAKFCAWACGKYKLPPVDTLEEFTEAYVARAVKILNKWDELLHEIEAGTK